MHAIELLGRLDEHDTQADAVEGAPRRIRLHRRLVSREETRTAHLLPSSEARIAPPPIESGRLDQLRMRETVARRTSTATDAEPSAPSSFGIELPRSQDLGQQIHVEGDQIVVIGIARGIAPPLPGARFGRPVTISVAVDGLLYAVRLAPGDTAFETIERLAAKLVRRFEVVVRSTSDDVATLRLVAPLPSPLL